MFVVELPTASIVGPDEIYLMEADTLRLECNVSGVPVPSKVSWLLGGEFSASGALLQKMGAGLDESGDWRCEAENIVGSLQIV